jgi:hypothetical protein
MLWLEHSSFTRELKILNKKYAISDGMRKIKKLLEVQFDPITPREVIAPGKLHCCTRNGVWELWKVEVLVSGLKPNQWPRVWFVLSGDTITFLTLGSHINNYSDDKMEKVALDRLAEFY